MAKKSKKKRSKKAVWIFGFLALALLVGTSYYEVMKMPEPTLSFNIPDGYTAPKALGKLSKLTWEQDFLVKSALAADAEAAEEVPAKRNDPRGAAMGLSIGSKNLASNQFRAHHRNVGVKSAHGSFWKPNFHSK